jgi:hypothetical protein
VALYLKTPVYAHYVCHKVEEKFERQYDRRTREENTGSDQLGRLLAELEERARANKSVKDDQHDKTNNCHLPRNTSGKFLTSQVDGSYSLLYILYFFTSLEYAIFVTRDHILS